MHRRGTAVHLDIGTHANKFWRMHKAVLKNLLFQNRRALGGTHHCHELRLQIGWEAWERLGGHIHRFHPAVLACHLETLFGLFHVNTRLMQLGDKTLHQVQTSAQKLHFAATEGRRQHKGAQLNPIGDNRVGRPMQAVHTLHCDLGGAVTINLCAHGAQTGGQIDNLWLTCCVFDHRGAFGQRGRHQDVLSGPHRGKSQLNHRTFKAVWRLGVQISVFQLNLCSELFQTKDVQIHRTRADRAATRQRHNRMPQTR
mmetsp:Transcript_27491/g.50826  ORF Transcript_27491/g.50826 Transcript_27491/m.50826 type:complete len:255 (+) Transcript_27491:1931-2695(+)